MGTDVVTVLLDFRSRLRSQQARQVVSHFAHGEISPSLQGLGPRDQFSLSIRSAY
jgi:hypothetical protein